jgi:hypothetical protein|tara:strand:- start:149 stop:877 length:729 start_codon:yes stop_codon:yes gene_type:complete
MGSNSGMIAGAFSSVSGKADKTLDTNGQILYYNSGRQALNIGDEGQVLTVSGSDLPSWATAGSGTVEKLYDTTLGSSGSANSTQFEADFSSTPLTSSNYSHFEFWLTGNVTGGSCDVNFICDQSTDNNYYYSAQQYNASGSLTWFAASPDTTGIISDTSITDSAGDVFMCYGTAGFNPARTTDFNVFTWFYQYSNGYSQFTRLSCYTLLDQASEISYMGIGCVGSGSLTNGSRFQINGYKMT